MSDLELLFLVMVCLYGWECACWLRPGSIAFVTWFGRRWHARQPGSFLGNRLGGFILAPPLPPLGCVLTGNEFPFSLATEGILSGSGLFRRFDAIDKVEAKGKKLRVNGELLAKAASPALADHLATTLQQLIKTPASGRAEAIEKILRAHLDSKAIKQRWRAFQSHSALIRWLVNALFCYVFLVIPALIWTLGVKFTWIGLLAGLLALTTSTAIFFRRAHKSFYPAAEDERFTHFMLILLSPVTSIRALDSLSRPLLETFHPLAITYVVCSEAEFRERAARLLRDLRFPPLTPSSDAGVKAAADEWRSLLRKTIEGFLQQHGLNPDELLRPPKRLDETCRAYCPRCLSQFTQTEGACPDCGSLELRALEKNTV